MNIETAKTAIDKMSAFLPDYILNDLYKDHTATSHIVKKDDNKIVFCVFFNNGEKRSLDVIVTRNDKANDVRLHRYEITVRYSGNMQVFSQLISADFYNDIMTTICPQKLKSGTVEKRDVKMCATRQSKKHLYNVHDVLIDLDNNTKGISQYAFICSDKNEAIMARNNVQNSILKGHLRHKYKTKTVNSVDLNGHVLWFCIVYKLDQVI